MVGVVAIRQGLGDFIEVLVEEHDHFAVDDLRGILEESAPDVGERDVVAHLIGGRHKAESLARLIPLGEAIARIANPAGGKCQPSELRIVANVLHDEVTVAAAAGIGVQDRPAGVDLFGLATNKAGVKFGVAELHLHRAASSGHPDDHGAKEQRDGDAGHPHEESATGVDLGASCDRHGSSGGCVGVGGARLVSLVCRR